MERIDDLRVVWPYEEYDFSKWLAKEENLDALGDAIGMDLELEERESPVGNFSVDIYAHESGTSRGVIIENQLEETDHDHLGKIITYAAGKEAEVIIWIVKRARDEHKQAVEWLNQHTDENIGVFLIEIELWRIGNSPLAPRFNVVERPNEWAKTMKIVENLTPLRKFKLDFWQKFCDYAFSGHNEFSRVFSQRKCLAANWYNLSTGVSSVTMEFTVPTTKHRVTAGLYISGRETYNRLKEKAPELEAKLGGQLEWTEGTKDGRIFLKKSIGEDFKNKNYQPYYDWFMEKALIFRQFVQENKD